MKAFTPIVNYTPLFDLLVLGTNSMLLTEGPPFGHLPPTNATTVDQNVVQFFGDTAVVYMLDGGRNLWVDTPPFGQIPPKRVQVDGNVKTFRPVDGECLFVLSTDENGTLWFEFPPYGTNIPPKRV